MEAGLRPARSLQGLSCIPRRSAYGFGQDPSEQGGASHRDSQVCMAIEAEHVEPTLRRAS